MSKGINGYSIRIHDAGDAILLFRLLMKNPAEPVTYTCGCGAKAKYESVRCPKPMMFQGDMFEGREKTYWCTPCMQDTVWPK